MAFVERKKPDTEIRDSEEQQEPDTPNGVTSFLQLKSRAQESAAQEQRAALDKDVVLRRIRHRKRMNKVRDAMQTLVSGTREEGSWTNGTERRWLDDAFSAP